MRLGSFINLDLRVPTLLVAATTIPSPDLFLFLLTHFSRGVPLRRQTLITLTQQEGESHAARL